MNLTLFSPTNFKFI